MAKPASARRLLGRLLLLVLGSMALLALLCATRFVCISAWVLDGMRVRQCPEGEPVQTVEITGWSLQRGGTGTVMVSAWGNYSTGPADQAQKAIVRRIDAELFLVDAEGKETPLEPEDGWDESGGYASAQVFLPQVPDGDYLLRARVETPLGESTEDAPLPLYAPARAHLLTDRPLYEAGHTVKFRVLVLRTSDLSPLDGRPGRFQVRDPDGLVVMEERAPAGDWGIAASDIPLDPSAREGTWTVAWISGDLEATAQFDVRPFTLPRFSVEAGPDSLWYEPGDAPMVTGRVVYSSGAPVADAALEIDWSVEGPWPPPTDWQQGALPKHGSTDADGAFVLELPPVPEDLLGEASLVGRIRATSPAGDVEVGTTRLLLSEDPIDAEAVTELEGGLVEGFNNRVYLRVTTPDGAPLRNAKLMVKRAWDPRDPGIEAETDADGVAALQVDPGPPVNVLVPAQPIRPPPRPDPVQRTGSRDLARAGDPLLSDQLALDRLSPRLQPCARFVLSGEKDVRLGLVLDGSGRVRDVTAVDQPLSLCLASVLRATQFPSGPERLLSLEYRVSAPDLALLRPSTEGAPGVPGGLEEQIANRAANARLCLPENAGPGELLEVLSWRSRARSRQVELRWLEAGAGGVLSPSERACVRSAFDGLALPSDAIQEDTGITRFRYEPAPSRSEARSQPTTMLGYELLVSAAVGGEALGETVLRLQPGSVPPVRLRAEPVLARPGEVVTIEVLRGPDFSGVLPEELFMTPPEGDPLKTKLDPETRKASFTLPAGLDGWYQVELMGSRALVYVAPTRNLEVEVSPEKERLAPGETALVQVRTRAGGDPVPAAVSLVGVDATLGQLVPLPGPDSLDALRASVETASPAFGALDGQALAMGRIQGANAAAATVLRVSRVPDRAERERPVNVSMTGSFDPVLELTDRFYVVLAELHDRVRRWEREAPEGEQMQPETMARLWKEAREAVEDQGGLARDAYGRPLRLSQLPGDLLALTDPRQVVVEGTRLPEDVENWGLWVAREDPR